LIICINFGRSYAIHLDKKEITEFMSKFKLFCLPYAGGSATMYKSWKNYLDPSIELTPIELAGRGTRFNTPLYNTLDEAIDDIFSKIKDDITKQPYALFGHSMGALLSYELVRKIKSMKLPAPNHIFFSGRKAPHVKIEKKKKYHLMDDEEFKQEIIKLGGTPPEFFQHKELTDFFLPMLKNDFKIAAISFYERDIDPFEFDISILLGKDEKVTPEQAVGWKLHTNGLCAIYYFNGGHFFLHDEIKQITSLINNTLSRLR